MKWVQLAGESEVDLSSITCCQGRNGAWQWDLLHKEWSYRDGYSAASSSSTVSDSSCHISADLHYRPSTTHEQLFDQTQKFPTSLVFVQPAWCSSTSRRGRRSLQNRAWVQVRRVITGFLRMILCRIRDHGYAGGWQEGGQEKLPEVSKRLKN